MSAGGSVRRRRARCQAVGCLEPAAPVAVEVIVPATGGLELALRLCPLHRAEVERGLEAAGEAIFEAGVSAMEAAARAGWSGLLS